MTFPDETTWTGPPPKLPGESDDVRERVERLRVHVDDLRSMMPDRHAYPEQWSLVETLRGDADRILALLDLTKLPREKTVTLRVTGPEYLLDDVVEDVTNEARRGHGVRVERDREGEALRAEVERLRTAVAFARSVIKGGEPWTDQCEEMLTLTTQGGDR